MSKIKELVDGTGITTTEPATKNKQKPIIAKGFLDGKNFSGTPADKGLAALLKPSTPAAQSDITFSHLLLKDLIPDPKQPRHYYSQAEEDEMLNSVKENGILQPILVRPQTNGKYMIVCGERRYRAAYSVMAAFASRNTIPATIRHLTDDEALEIQIIENLQRKDVQPMEEATSFQSLKERYTIEEIALRVGKSAQYVAQRMQLTNLVAGFQEMLFEHKMKLVQAYKLCRLPAESQERILKEATRYGADWRKKKDYELGNIDHYLNSELHDLSGATFKTNDPNLYPEMGACTGCRYNTANSPLLFDELNKKRFCRYGVCFTIKTNKSYQAKINKVIEEPDVLLVSFANYASNEEKQQLKAVTDMGATVLPADVIEVVMQPDPVMSWEQYLKEEDNRSDDEDMSAEEKQEALAECKSDYEDYVARWNEDMEKYQAITTTGAVKKAFAVTGSDRAKAGQMIDVIIKPKGAGSAFIGNSSGELNASVEIATLQGKEARNCELDAEKVYKNVTAALKEPFLQLTTAPLLPQEVRALALVLTNISYKARDFVQKQLATGDDYNRIKTFKKMESLTEESELFLQLVRLAIYDNLRKPEEADIKKYGGAAALFDIARLWIPDQVKQIEDEQKLVSNKRKEKVKARIDALKKQAETKTEAAA